MLMAMDSLLDITNNSISKTGLDSVCLSLSFSYFERGGLNRLNNHCQNIRLYFVPDVWP